VIVKRVQPRTNVKVRMAPRERRMVPQPDVGARPRSRPAPGEHHGPRRASHVRLDFAATKRPDGLRVPATRAFKHQRDARHLRSFVPHQGRHHVTALAEVIEDARREQDSTGSSPRSSRNYDLTTTSWGHRDRASLGGRGGTR
jgi:hypothetical protein